MADSNKDEKQKENMFEIMDGIILQLNRTKKMFIIMIITVMVISPIALLITYLVFTPPFEGEREEKMRREAGGFHKFFPIRYLPPIVSAVWLAIGIRQWFVLSKWTAKYDKYKKLQEEIDKKLSDEDKDSEQK